MVKDSQRFLGLIFLWTYLSLIDLVTTSVFIRKELVSCEQEIKDPTKPNNGNLTSCTQRLFLSLKIIQDEKVTKNFDYGFTVYCYTYCKSVINVYIHMRCLLRLRNEKPSFQVENKHLFVIVDNAFDVTAREEVRLIRPLVLKIIQQPVTLAYPFKYMFVSSHTEAPLLIKYSEK